MIHFYLDKFDTELLKKNAYKLIIGAEGDFLKEAPDAFRTIQAPAMICCISEFSTDNIDGLQENGFKFISTKNTYHTAISSLKTVNDEINKLEIIRLTEVRGNELPDIESFDALIRVIAEKGRFYKDAGIPKDDALMVYKKWVFNSLFNGFADEVILLKIDEKIAGFISLKDRDGIGTIDLIMIDNQFQGRGLGSALLSHTKDYFLGKDISTISVETEAENIQSNIFYQKNGFILKNFQLIFHKHYD